MGDVAEYTETFRRRPPGYSAGRSQTRGKVIDFDLACVILHGEERALRNVGRRAGAWLQAVRPPLPRT